MTGADGTGRTQPPPATESGGTEEHRRSARYPAALSVRMAAGAERQLVRTVDVSQHGLFVATDRPPRERMIVDLTIFLPDGSLGATGFVSRTVDKRSSPAASGVGLQLFALGAKEKGRWDRYLGSLAGGETADAGRAPDLPTFLIRLRDGARLLEFFEKSVMSQEVYLATPVIKEPGSEVSLIVIHPLSDAEFPIVGRVAAVHREPPKGMAIKLQGAPEALRGAFRQFASTGQTPAPIVVPALPKRAPTLEILIEEPVPYVGDSQDFDWRDVSEDLIVDFDLDEDEAAPGVTLSALDAQPPIPAPPEGLRSLEPDWGLRETAQHEIVKLPPEVDLDLTTDGTSDITRAESPLDPDLESPLEPLRASAEAPATAGDASRTPTLETERTGEVTTEDLSPPEMPETGPLARLEPIQEPEVAVRLVCRECRAAPTTLLLGGVTGPLGLLARRRPYACPRCEAIVAVVRMRPVSERRRVRERLWLDDPDALDARVELSLLFEVASLATSSARCPICGSAGRANDTTQAIEEVLPALEPGRAVMLPRGRCPTCGAQALAIELAELD